MLASLRRQLLLYSSCVVSGKIWGKNFWKRQCTRTLGGVSWSRACLASAPRHLWNLRTWRHVTSTLQLVVGDSCEKDQASLCEPTNQQLLVAPSFIARPVGRPRGSKDSRPRRRRVVDQAAGADASAHSAAVPQSFCQPLSLADAFSLDCVSFPSPPCGQCPSGERIWCAEPAERPASGPPSVAGCQSPVALCGRRRLPRQRLRRTTTQRRAAPTPSSCKTRCSSCPA